MRDARARVRSASPPRARGAVVVVVKVNARAVCVR
jgi:hypothetical protein